MRTCFPGASHNTEYQGIMLTENAGERHETVSKYNPDGAQKPHAMNEVQLVRLRARGASHSKQGLHALDHRKRYQEMFNTCERNTLHLLRLKRAIWLSNHLLSRGTSTIIPSQSNFGNISLKLAYACMGEERLRRQSSKICLLNVDSAVHLF